MGPWGPCLTAGPPPPFFVIFFTNGSHTMVWHICNRCHSSTIYVTWHMLIMQRIYGQYMVFTFNAYIRAQDKAIIVPSNAPTLDHSRLTTAKSADYTFCYIGIFQNQLVVYHYAHIRKHCMSHSSISREKPRAGSRLQKYCISNICVRGCTSVFYVSSCSVSTYHIASR